jgi:hypothetical protein
MCNQRSAANEAQTVTTARRTVVQGVLEESSTYVRAAGPSSRTNASDPLRVALAGAASSRPCGPIPTSVSGAAAADRLIRSSPLVPARRQAQRTVTAELFAPATR